METFIMQHLHAIGPFIYLILALFLLIEGEMVLFLTTYLAHQGFLDIRVVLPVAFCSAMSGDIIWYFFGGRLARSRWLGPHIARVASPVDAFLKKHPIRTISVSKFTYGLNRATISRVRASGVAFSKFISVDVVTVICWMSIVCGLAWGASTAFEQMKAGLKYAELGLLGAVCAFIIVSRILSYVGQRRLSR